MDILILLLFSAMLLTAMLTGLSLLWALLGGLVLFSLYARGKGFSFKEIGKMCLDGMYEVRNLLIVFLLIGFLTALWRLSGTIPEILSLSSGLFTPALFLPVVFLLNSLLSFLIGTSFGTVATMGVITMTLGRVLGLDPALLGGAVLSGIYFGDRCSPLSTSAMLVRELTGTDMPGNMRGMLRTGFFPFMIALGLYAFLGRSAGAETAGTDISALFSRSFTLTPWLLLPAVTVLVLSLLRVNVKLSMLAGIVTAAALCFLVQKTPESVFFKALFSGYVSGDAEINGMLSGGGLVSMLSTTSIVCLSCAFSRIFEKTGLLDRIRTLLGRLSEKLGGFTTTALASVFCCAVACNQTLAIILTTDLCRPFTPEKTAMAMRIEDTAVVIAGLIPWCIACSTPLSILGASNRSILFAFFLWLLPLEGIMQEIIQKYVKKDPALCRK